MAQNIVTQRILKIVELMLKNKVVKSISALARSLSYRPNSFDKVKNNDRNFPLEIIHTFVNLYNINPTLLFNDDAWKTVCDADGEIKEYGALLLNPIVEDRMEIELTSFPIPVVSEPKAYIENHKNPSFIQNLQYITCDVITTEIQQGRAIQTKGDDMEPNFVDGDWIIADVIENYDTLLYNRMYVIVTSDAILVRRIVNIDTKKDQIVLAMDNHGYPSYAIALHTVLEIWKVQHVLKSRFPIPTESLVKQEF